MSPASEDPAAAAIRSALAARGAGKTVCPSEVARQLAGDSPDWRERMSEVHRAVDAMVAAGSIRLSWKGHCLAERQGPYRIAGR